MPEPVGITALKPTAAASYPHLPAPMWTMTARLAELVGKYRGISAKAVNRLNRVLSDRDFMFKGRAGDRITTSPAGSGEWPARPLVPPSAGAIDSGCTPVHL